MSTILTLKQFPNIKRFPRHTHKPCSFPPTPPPLPTPPPTPHPYLTPYDTPYPKNEMEDPPYALPSPDCPYTLSLCIYHLPPLWPPRTPWSFKPYLDLGVLYTPTHPTPPYYITVIFPLFSILGSWVQLFSIPPYLQPNYSPLKPFLSFLLFLKRNGNQWQQDKDIYVISYPHIFTPLPHIQTSPMSPYFINFHWSPIPTIFIGTPNNYRRRSSKIDAIIKWSNLSSSIEFGGLLGGVLRDIRVLPVVRPEIFKNDWN